jgi:adenylyltransferase/sulfurtransferase
MDGSDNFETRYLLNDACVKNNKPWIYSGVIGAYGVTSTIVPNVTPCFRCLFPEQPPAGSTPTCDTAGILNSIVGTIGSIASGEALKLLVGQGKLNAGLLSIDLWQNNFDRLPITAPLPGCSTCDLHQYEFLDSAGDRGSQVAVLCGRNAVQVSMRGAHQLALDELGARLQKAGATKLLQNEYLLRCQLDSYEFTVFPDARAIIKGTEEANVAKSLYARYIGV